MKNHFYILALFLVITACKSVAKTSNSPTDSNKTLDNHPLKAFYNEALKPFYYGVASGDPLQNAVIIWTHISPINTVKDAELTWQVSTDSLFKMETRSGTTRTNANKDFTVKVDVSDLKPDQTYYYRFISKSDTSVVGRTKTAASHSGDLKFAVTSCSNYEWGYFNAYARMAEETDLDAIIHLGDYIYEYGRGTYGDTSLSRKNIPKHEILSLSDYRTRYALYRLDEDLMAAHRKHPFIAIWDDHEISNNAYVDGAQNHQANEGAYSDRRKVARQVYYEWMPIRESDKHYRMFKFGNLADLVMLDERLAGRSKQADSVADPSRVAMDHKLLGDRQFKWLETQLQQSQARWKLIGNGVTFSRQDWGSPNFRLNMDSWDGYPKDQQRLMDFIKNNKLQNLIFLTGDTHTAWAFEATNNPFKNYDANTGEGAVAIEFGVTSINSANANETSSDDEVLLQEIKLMSPELNPHLKYVNRRDHGYLLLELTDSVAKAEFKIVPSVKEKAKGVSVDRTFWVESGTVKLKAKQ